MLYRVPPPPPPALPRILQCRAFRLMLLPTSPSVATLPPACPGACECPNSYLSNTCSKALLPAHWLPLPFTVQPPRSTGTCCNRCDLCASGVAPPGSWLPADARLHACSNPAADGAVCRCPRQEAPTNHKTAPERSELVQCIASLVYIILCNPCSSV